MIRPTELEAQVDGPYLIIGTRHWWPGWTHVEADPTPLYCDEDGSQHPADLVCDARNVPLPDGYAGLVFSSECLEHFSWRITGDVVAEWCRLVRPGGLIRIEVPDFLAACQQILDGGTTELDLRMQQIFFAEQTSLVWDAHFAGLTHRTLRYFLEKVGMEVVGLRRGWECGWLRVDARKGRDS